MRAQNGQLDAVIVRPVADLLCGLSFDDLRVDIGDLLSALIGELLDPRLALRVSGCPIRPDPAENLARALLQPPEGK